MRSSSRQWSSPVTAVCQDLPALVVYNARIGADARCSPWALQIREVPVETLLQDLRYGLRTLRNSPGFTLVAVLTLALGIGATSAIFSVVDRVLFRSLPYPEDARLVSVGLKAPLDANEFMLAMDYVEWRKSAPPFVEMGSMLPGGFDCDFTEQNPLRMTCARVDAHNSARGGLLLRPDVVSMSRPCRT
jgi:hypothetical protein